MNLSFNESLKIIRKEARENGLTFKRSNTRLNGAYLWKLEDRKTGETVMSNYQFNTAFNDVYSGYIQSYDTESRMFAA